MTDKIKIVIEHVDEWKKKDFTKDFEKYVENFTNFIQGLEVNKDEANEILAILDKKVNEEKASSKSLNDANAFTQHAADIFFGIIDDINNNYEDDDSLKDLVKE